MNFSNAYYSKKLIGRQASLDLLQGRDFRPDRHHLFSTAEEEKNIWYKTFSVGLDQSCQEAYIILGLLLDDENIIKEAGAGVMYMDSGTGNCMFSFASDEDSEADVDDIEADSLAEGPDEPEEEDAPEADDDEEEEDSWEETPRAKRIMDILPLDEMLTGRKPYFLEHEAAMIIKGRWLPEAFSPDDAPLPRHLASRFLTGAEQEKDDAYPILNEISFEIKHDPAYDSFDGNFDILANRGTRYFVCNFDGNRKSGEWRINYFNVDSYASTGSGFGNLFNRPSTLSDNGHDYQQACLLLVDFYDDEEFGKLMN